MNNYRFPKYARLNMNGCIMMRSSISNDGFSAQYYRPCGEWGCTIKLRHFEYTSDDPYMKGQEINFVSCTPREFIEDNEYCVIKRTAELFKIAIEDIKETEPNFAEGHVEIQWDNLNDSCSYIPKIIYKENNIINSKEKFYKWKI